ncbi:MAG: dienelactone hydrolase family protein [Betaproteobacteria bacterium]|nr:dienelactone hydrolase family protein [Betaproteobacteria bacterium]MDH4293645.1 dienelactone hydrolase family protein [Betaproteobacteria bacterium]MDH5341853.1 dienelactone hydrolase family protein [Betaproteobacteria bacterium]
MERKKASDYPPEVMKLFDGYVHGAMTRRDFLERAGKFAVGAFTATAMLESLQPNFAWAQQVPKDDPRIRTQYLDYDSPQGHGRMRGYYAAPANAKGKLPAVLVIHENRGLNPYIEDVARRFATANFVAFAPDALTPLGGYPGNEDEARKLFASQDAKKREEDLYQAAQFLKQRPEAGKIGVVGFCFGGYISNYLATRMPDLAAAVPYYGRQVPAAEVPKIKAPLMLQFASDDENVNKTWPAYEAALKEHGIRYTAHVYPNTLHGFHNDTTPRYDEAAAKLSWQRTLNFFNQHLRS